MPHAVAAAASAVVGSITDQVSVRPSHIEHTTADGTNSAATTKAGRAWRWTASEDSASRPATVPDVENAPNRTHTSATPNGQRRRHHSERQQRAPNAASVTTRPEVIRLAVSSTATLRMTAPKAAAMTNAPASTDQSRAVLGPSVSGWAGSLGPSIAVEAVWADHLRNQDMTRAYGYGRPVQHRRKSTLQPTKGETSGASGVPSDIGSWPSARCAGASGGSGWPHDHDNRSHQELQEGSGRPRRLAALRTRDHHRLPRGQRRRQIDHAQ